MPRFNIREELVRRLGARTGEEETVGANDEFALHLVLLHVRRRWRFEVEGERMLAFDNFAGLLECVPEGACPPAAFTGETFELGENLLVENLLPVRLHVEALLREDEPCRVVGAARLVPVHAFLLDSVDERPAEGAELRYQCRDGHVRNRLHEHDTRNEARFAVVAVRLGLSLFERDPVREPAAFADRELDQNLLNGIVESRRGRGGEHQRSP